MLVLSVPQLIFVLRLFRQYTKHFFISPYRYSSSVDIYKIQDPKVHGNNPLASKLTSVSVPQYLSYRHKHDISITSYRNCFKLEPSCQIRLHQAPGWRQTLVWGLTGVKDKQRLWVGQSVTFLNGHYGRAIDVEMEVEKGVINQGG